MNYCSTSNTAWSPPETRAVYRKGRKVGEIVRRDHLCRWVELWFAGSERDREELDWQLQLANL